MVPSEALAGLAGVALFAAPGAGLAEILPAVRELGISVTAYGVLSRGLLSGSPITSPKDMRNRFPRFFFQVNGRRREIQAGAFLLVVLYGLLQHSSLLSILMAPFCT